MEISFKVIVSFSPDPPFLRDKLVSITKEGSLEMGLRLLLMRCWSHWRRRSDRCLLVSSEHSPDHLACPAYWAVEGPRCLVEKVSELARSGHGRQSTSVEDRCSVSVAESGEPWSHAHPGERQMRHMDAVLEHGLDEAMA
jgi:hypothetical protein